MALNDQEAAFVQRIRSSTHRLSEEIDKLAALADLYFDRTYNSGGVNEITDDDLADLDIDAADLASTVTAIQQLLNWRDNAAVTTGDYGATLNKVRIL